MEEPIDQHPLIIISLGDYHYYCSFRSAKNKFVKQTRIFPGEVLIHPTSKQTTIEQESYLDTSALYCMKKDDMEKFVNVNELKLDALNQIDQVMMILKALIKNLNVLPPFCSILQFDYDASKEILTPDLLYCHPELWDQTKITYQSNPRWNRSHWIEIGNAWRWLWWRATQNCWCNELQAIYEEWNMICVVC